MNNEQTQIVVESRAHTVANKLQNLTDTHDGSFLDICELLYEVDANKYYLTYGATSFEGWVTGGAVELGIQNARYLLKIGKYMRQLNLGREELKAAKVAKLKEVFRLDINTQADLIRKLVVDAASMTYSEVKALIDQYKGLSNGEPVEYITLKMTVEVKNKLKDAIDLAKANYGDTIDADGKPVDISNSKAIELIAENFLQDANNYPEKKVVGPYAV
jgi:hypothetical protein